MKKTAYLVLLWLIPLAGLSVSNSVELTDNVEEYHLGKHVSILIDTSRQLTFEDISSGQYDSLFEPSTTSSPQFRNTKANYWIRIDVINNCVFRNTWILHQPEFLSTFDLHVVDDDRSYTLTGGGMQPQLSRFFDYESLAHRLHIDFRKTKRLYLLCNSSFPLTFDLSIYSHRTFINKSTRLQYCLGLYYGIIAVLFVLSIFNFIIQKHRNYLFYGLYILCIALMIFTIDGKMLRYIMPGEPVFALKFLGTALISGSFFGICYAQNFLNTKRVVPLIHKLLTFFAVFLVLAAVLNMMLPFELTVGYVRIIPMPAMLLVLLAGLICMKKGYAPARLYVIAFGSFAVGATISLLAFEAFIPAHPLLPYAVHAGSALEAIILLFALSQQISLMKKKNESAHLQIIEQLEENQQLQTKVTRELEGKVQERTAELEEKKEAIEAQNIVISKKNEAIMDGISYARGLQDAILISEDELDKILADYFLIYKPSHVVSGDFYWVHSNGNGEKTVAVADCTGHGVPGALLSMIGNALLSEIIITNKVTATNKILEELNSKFIDLLNKNTNQREEKVSDGMDIALYTLREKQGILEYSGAFNPLYHIRNGKLTEYKATRTPIGMYQFKAKPFIRNEVAVEKGDMVYIFSDGYADQFGGKKQKKFMYPTFKDLLCKNSNKPLKEQKSILIDTINEWKGDLPQYDDICIIGLRV